MKPENGNHQRTATPSQDGVAVLAFGPSLRVAQSGRALNPFEGSQVQILPRMIMWILLIYTSGLFIFPIATLFGAKIKGQWGFDDRFSTMLIICSILWPYVLAKFLIAWAKAGFPLEEDIHVDIF